MTERGMSAVGTDWNAKLGDPDRNTVRREGLRKAGVPERALKAVFDGVEETEAVRAVRAFLATADSFLVLAGRPGSGKTVAAAVALAEVPPERTVYENPWAPEKPAITEKARTIAFEDAHGLAQASNFDGEMWAHLRRVHLLVIDDTGRELLDNTGRALGNLVNLLCRRHDDAKRTICTTNLDMQGWIKRFCAQDGGRLLDRMREQEHQHRRSPFYAVSGSSLRGPSQRAPLRLDNPTAPPPSQES